MWVETGPAAIVQRKKHKNAYYRFRNTAISLKSARLSFIKRKQILMYFYTLAAVFVAPTPPPTPPSTPASTPGTAAGAVRGVEAKSNYFYSGEMSAAKSLILINGAAGRSLSLFLLLSPTLFPTFSNLPHLSRAPPRYPLYLSIDTPRVHTHTCYRSHARSSTRITHNSNASK